MRRNALAAVLAGVALVSTPSVGRAEVAGDVSVQLGAVYSPSARAVDGALPGLALSAGYDLGWVRPELALFAGFHYEFLSWHVALRPGLRFYPFHQAPGLLRGAYVRSAFDLEGVWRTEHGIFYGLLVGAGWEARLWRRGYLLVEGEVDWLFGPEINQLTPSLRLGGGVRF